MRRFWLICFVLIAIGARAQDPSFSQYFANRIYLNPAFTGINRGMRAALNYRNQWPYIPGTFSTSGFGIDVKEPSVNGGLGFVATHDVSGEGYLKTTRFGFIYNYNTTLVHERADISFALQANGVSKSIDWDRLSFSDQYDPVLGKIYSTSSQRPPSTSLFYADFDFGTVFRFLVKTPSRDVFSHLGLAIHHLTQPEESILGTGNTIPRRYTIHGGTQIPLGRFKRTESPTFLFPSFKYEIQQKFRAYDVSCFLYKSPGFVGLSYRNSPGISGFRNTDGIILALGFIGNISKGGGNFQLGYSYDFNSTGLGARTWGAHEISLLLVFDDFRLTNLRQSAYNRKKTTCFSFKSNGIFNVF